MEALAEPVLAYRAPVLRPTPDVHDINNVEDPVATRVLAALRDKTPSRRGRERRSERRYPYPHPVYLTPLTSDGPRRMIASLQVGGQWLGLVLDLKWCRFTADGLYDNGGRFVDTVPSPLAEP
jgi:hypothetical protein